MTTTTKTLMELPDWFLNAPYSLHLVEFNWRVDEILAEKVRFVVCWSYMDGNVDAFRLSAVSSVAQMVDIVNENKNVKILWVYDSLIDKMREAKVTVNVDMQLEEPE